LQGKTAPPIFPVPVGVALVRHLETLPTATWKRVLILGLCGSLDPRYGVGDIVLYHTCMGLDKQPQACDPELAAALAQLLAPNTAQVLALTTPTVVFRAADKQRYGKQLGAQVVDMEGLIAQRALTAKGTAVGMIRVVSDDCHQDLPDLSKAFDAQGQLQPSVLAQAFLKSPWAGAQLAQGSMKALMVLTQLAGRFR
jgi:nucleoside phosphorylase